MPDSEHRLQMQDEALVEFNNFRLANRIGEILDTLPEYGQAEFFDEDVRQGLVDRLNLRGDEWRGLFRSIWRSVGRYGYVRVRNLPFDENNRLSVALASMLGCLLPHNVKVPTPVRRIRPRPGKDPQENHPHTDSPHWMHPNDMIALQCEREDQHLSVFSRIARVSDVERLVVERDKELHFRLFNRDYPFLLIAEQGDAGYQMQPVFTKSREGGALVTHARFCLPDSIRCVKEFGLDASCLDDLERLDYMADESGRDSEFVLRKGDWLIFDNKRTFHSKTHTSEDTVRVLRKLKLNIDREALYGVHAA